MLANTFQGSVSVFGVCQMISWLGEVTTHSHSIEWRKGAASNQKKVCNQWRCGHTRRTMPSKEISGSMSRLQREKHRKLEHRVRCSTGACVDRHLSERVQSIGRCRVKSLGTTQSQIPSLSDAKSSSSMDTKMKERRHPSVVEWNLLCVFVCTYSLLHKFIFDESQCK